MSKTSMNTDEIVQGLRDIASHDGEHSLILRKVADRLEKLFNNDAKAATYVESVIVSCSPRFTGEPPYVGWEGLGLALRQDYAELFKLREDVEALGNAAWQVLDDMGEEGLSTCRATKAQLRITFRRVEDKIDNECNDYDDWMSYEDAKKIIDNID